MTLTPSFFLKRGDTLPTVSATLSNYDGTAINLTDSTVRLVYRAADGSGTATRVTATIESAEDGEVSYAWQTGDTATAGNYVCEWEITFSGGSILTVPNGSYIPFTILADLI